MGQLPTREELIDLYKIHVEEVRFEVKLNWDRTQYLLVLNIGILGAAATIWKSDAVLPHYILLGGLFVVGLCTAWVAQKAIRKGHSYYHNARRQKTMVECALGLHDVPLGIPNEPSSDLTISTTDGMAKEIARLTQRTPSGPAPVLKGGQVTWYLLQIFKLIALLNILGLVLAGANIIALSELTTHVSVGQFDLGLFTTVATALIIPLLLAIALNQWLSKRRSSSKPEEHEPRAPSSSGPVPPPQEPDALE